MLHSSGRPTWLLDLSVAWDNDPVDSKNVDSTVLFTYMPFWSTYSVQRDGSFMIARADLHDVVT